MNLHPLKYQLRPVDLDLLDLEEELNNYKIQATELQLENTD